MIAEDMMVVRDAMKERHTVRKYLDKSLPDEVVVKLRARLNEINKVSGLGLTLVTGSSDGLGNMAKLISRNVKNYIALAGPDRPDLDEMLGYWGAYAMLFAQSIGLNSWWIGGMFNAAGAAKHLPDSGLRVNGVIAVGYGATQGTPHKSKKSADISLYSGAAPQWFHDGVEALLLAPTALNRQAYHVRGSGSKVALDYDDGHFSKIDLGIGRYHFEAGAGKENFEWVDTL